MKPLRTRMEESRKRLGLPWEVLERDYLLSWILAGICRVPSFHDTLVFKGGTALRKCYFGDYRFSEDLDFTGIGSIPTGVAMEAAIRDACAVAADLLNLYAPVEIVSTRHVERDPHPADQEAFDIRARFPWHRGPYVRVSVEVSTDEKVLRPTVRRPLFHDYGEAIETELTVYSLEEIVAEKLRAILQHVQSLERRGWARSRARDYYDLWRILTAYRDRMGVYDFRSLLRAKCVVRDVAFTDTEDFFTERMLSVVERTWESWLGPLVPDLPNCAEVINQLRPLVADLLGS